MDTSRRRLRNGRLTVECASSFFGASWFLRGGIRGRRGLKTWTLRATGRVGGSLKSDVLNSPESLHNVVVVISKVSDVESVKPSSKKNLEIRADLDDGDIAISIWDELAEHVGALSLVKGDRVLLKYPAAEANPATVSFCRFRSCWCDGAPLAKLVTVMAMGWQEQSHVTPSVFTVRVAESNVQGASQAMRLL
eukprot:9503770-Pyramimonas_sp.AAC.1